MQMGTATQSMEASRCRSSSSSPYDVDGAGDINSNIEDMAKWVSLQLAGGTFDGRRIVSPENLAYTRTPKVAPSDKAFYALGWIVQQTPNGTSSGTMVELSASAPLSAARSQCRRHRPLQPSNVGMPDALGLWILDRLLGNPRSTTRR